MREFFKGWRRKTGCVALVMALVAAACFVVVCIREGLKSRDPAVIGLLFIIGNIGVFGSPVICGGIAALIGRRLGSSDYWSVVMGGIVVGLVVSAICFPAVKHLVFEYMA